MGSVTVCCGRREGRGALYTCQVVELTMTTRKTRPGPNLSLSDTSSSEIPGPESFVVSVSDSITIQVPGSL